jgi:endonuclease-3
MRIFKNCLCKNNSVASPKDIPEIIRKLKKIHKKFKPPIVTEISMRSYPFRVLISCILSLRTKDKTTAKASEKLFKVADTPKKLAKLNTKRIERLIYPVGFYKTKARRIREIAKVLIGKYNSKVPDTFEELLKLKGVGRKTANIVMSLGHKSREALAVDVHVHVISNRLGLVKSKNPDETEMQLRKVLPKRYWPVYNDYLVVYGQHICTTAYPKCGSCVIAKHCIYPKKDFSRKIEDED